jgi:hypothetical protein
MKQWIIDAIHDGFAVCYIDPHGHDTADLLQYIPAARRPSTIVFDPTRYSIPWNPLTAKNIPLTASVFAEAIKIAWGYSNATTPRMDGMIYNSLAALMETKQGLFGLYLLIVSDTYRAHIIKDIKDPVIKHYWTWFDALPKKQQYEQAESTINKIQVLMADPRIRDIAGTQTGFSIEDMVQDGILFISLPQGELGVQKSAVIGSMLLVEIHQAAMRRDPAVPFYLFVDEVHTFASTSLREMLSGIRKHNVSLTLCHQYVGQLDPLLWSSIRANCDSYVFRTSFDDSRHFPELGDQELQPHELDLYQRWCFGHGKPTLGYTSPLSYEPYKAAARQIQAHHTRNLSRPATREIAAMCEKYLDVA